MELPKELEELKALKQWVCYKNVWDEKKQKNKKVPRDANTGKGAKANDSETWNTYTVAIEGEKRFNLDGVGFEFASGYLGIDLDNVIDANGNLTPVASEIVELIDSYTEHSPSGKGLHVLCKTSLRKIGRRNDEIGLEMYNYGRFFTITGKPYGEPRPIQERTEQVKEIYKRYLHKPQREDEVKPVQKGQIPPSTVESAFENLSDSELWQRIFSSQHGREIFELYQGNLSGYGDDHSRADLALCSHLAYWTNCDESRMDRMFRQSGLMRPKWDERHGAQTYGAMTLGVALRSVTPYIPVYSYSDSQIAGVISSRFIDTQNLYSKVEAEKPSLRFVGEYLEQKFKNDVYRFSGYKYRKTGFSNLDEKISLYPGLYVLGAVSSLGKTTFIGQLADQLAEAGDRVLYFSLEQSEFELVSKGISRMTARENLETAVSAIKIREGYLSDSVERAIENYRSIAGTEAIIECGFDTTIATITDTVRDYISKTGIRPVVIVDYLQIVRPIDIRQTAKDAVDVHVRAFKKLQVDNDLVVILISSLNRANYLTPVDFESFKESGGIEYTADVIWGLQLEVMNSEIFDGDKKLKQKREIVRQAKNENPRKIELVCLKNRYGISNYHCEFLYYAQYDLFVPLVDEKSEKIRVVF